MNKLSKQYSHLRYILALFISFLIISTPSFSQDISTSSDIFSLCKCSRCSSWLFEINNPLPHTDLPYNGEKNRTAGFYKLQSVPMDHFLDQARLLKFADTENNKITNRVKPPPHGGRIAGEILCGFAGSLVLGYAGVVLGRSTVEDNGWFSGLAETILGYTIGATIGSTLGVYLIGCIGGETGSFGATLVGSLLGDALGWGIILTQSEISWIITIIPAIGACIGFNLTRRYKTSHLSRAALVNFSEGQMHLDIPMVSFQPNPHGGKTIDWNINLLNVEF